VVVVAHARPKLIPRGKWLQQLNPVPERIEHIEAVETVERFVRHRGEAYRRATSGKFCQATHEKGWVRLARGTKIRVDTKVNPKGSAAKPDSATSRQVIRLRLLNETEDTAVEGSCEFLLASGHGQLDMIELEDLTHMS
jgi:hypothetical protein